MKRIVLTLLTVVLVFASQTSVHPRSEMGSDIHAPRYLDTTEFGTYVAMTNVLYQATADGGWKLVVDLGAGTIGYNTRESQAISDWRSFYITDLTAGYFYSEDHWASRNWAANYRGDECILISGMVFIPNPNRANWGMIADVFVMYYPRMGWVRAIHVNHRYSMTVTPEQYRMQEGHWFEYLEGELFPRGIISNDGSLDVYLLTGEANLNLMNSRNHAALIANGYGPWYWEIRRVTNAYAPDARGDRRVWSLFYGSIEVFEDRTRIPEIHFSHHTIDPALIVFRAWDNYNKFVIASIGTDDSQICTALEIDLTLETEDYYWIDRNEFLRMAGMVSNKIPGIPWGSQWSEKDMDSYIDK
jgi:hypothetical protein